MWSPVVSELVVVGRTVILEAFGVEVAVIVADRAHMLTVHRVDDSGPVFTPDRSSVDRLAEVLGRGATQGEQSEESGDFGHTEERCTVNATL